MFYAIQVYADGSKHFFDGEFQTIEALNKAIENWKKLVTPRMAQTTVFQIMRD